MMYYIVVPPPITPPLVVPPPITPPLVVPPPITPPLVVPPPITPPHLFSSLQDSYNPTSSLLLSSGFL